MQGPTWRGLTRPHPSLRHLTVAREVELNRPILSRKIYKKKWMLGEGRGAHSPVYAHVPVRNTSEKHCVTPSPEEDMRVERGLVEKRKGIGKMGR